ncbi:hypothetical protein Aduo_001629 [Ancylostoma duodenale]
MDSKMYCQIIHDNYLPFASKVYGLNCRLAQDNDPKHKSRYTTELLDMWNVHRIDWPPESPDLNPIELVWHQLKYYLRHAHKPHSKEELEEGILKFWTTKMTRTQCQIYIKHIHTAMRKVVAAKGSNIVE